MSILSARMCKEPENDHDLLPSNRGLGNTLGVAANPGFGETRLA